MEKFCSMAEACRGEIFIKLISQALFGLKKKKESADASKSVKLLIQRFALSFPGFLSCSVYPLQKLNTAGID